MNKKLCVIYATCQGIPIGNFLLKHKKYKQDYINCCFEDYKMISANEPLPDSMSFPLNEANLPCYWPMTPYVIYHYQLKYSHKEDLDWKNFYTKIIKEICLRKNNEVLVESK